MKSRVVVYRAGEGRWGHTKENGRGGGRWCSPIVNECPSAWRKISTIIDWNYKKSVEDGVHLLSMSALSKIDMALNKLWPSIAYSEKNQIPKKTNKRINVTGYTKI